MNTDKKITIESNALEDFSKAINAGDLSNSRAGTRSLMGGRLELDRDSTRNGLGRLVLTLVRLLHELLEKQAIRRMDSGSLTEDQIEQVGLTLMRQAEEIDRLRKEFGLEEKDLNLDLGPLGRLV
jgi:hypothetical protein